MSQLGASSHIKINSSSTTKLHPGSNQSSSKKPEPLSMFDILKDDAQIKKQMPNTVKNSNQKSITKKRSSKIDSVASQNSFATFTTGISPQSKKLNKIDFTIKTSGTRAKERENYQILDEGRQLMGMASGSKPKSRNQGLTSSNYKNSNNTVSVPQSTKNPKSSKVFTFDNIHPKGKAKSRERTQKAQQVISPNNKNDLYDKIQQKIQQKYVKTIEVDIDNILRNGKKHRRSGSQKHTVSGPQYVQRRDQYDEQVNELIDENIKEVARLTALKQAYQDKILDQSKVFQSNLKDINELNAKNAELSLKLSFAQEEQRHILLQISQIQKSQEKTEQQKDEVYAQITENLNSILEQKKQLKQKVNNDTKLTSETLKSLETMRSLSLQRVGQFEKNSDKASNNVQQLQKLLHRGKEVDNSRVQKISSKKSLLQSLIVGKSINLMVDDPKNHLNQEVRSIIVKTVKSSFKIKRRSLSQSQSLN